MPEFARNWTIYCSCSHRYHRQIAYVTVVVIEQFCWKDQGSKADESRFNLIHCLFQTLSYRRNTCRVDLDLLSYEGKNGLFAIRQPGLWQRKRYFEANIVSLPGIEGVSEHPGQPISNKPSGAGFTGCPNRSRGHFLCSIDRRCQPWNCERSGDNGLNILLIRCYQRTGLFINALSWDRPAKRHCNDL